MTKTAISEIFETLAQQFRQLHIRLDKFELDDSVRDEPFLEAFESCLNTIEESRAALRSILEASDRRFYSDSQTATTAQSDTEELHWRTHRLIKYVSLDLYDLWSNLSSLHHSVALFYLTDESTWTVPAIQSTKQGLSAAIGLALQVTADLEIRFDALARFYAQTESLDELIRGEDPGVDAAVSYYDEWRPGDIYHAAPATPQTHATFTEKVS